MKMYILAFLHWLHTPAKQPIVDEDSYEAGKRAFETGEARNPHRRGTVYHRSWRMGYMEEQRFSLMW